MTTEVRRSARLAAKAQASAGVCVSLVALPDKHIRTARASGTARTKGTCRGDARPTRRRGRRPQERKQRSIALPRLGIDDLPDEILWLILGDFTEPPWHAAIAQVSQRWRGIVVAWAARFPRGSAQCPFTLRQSTMRTAIRTNARSVAVWLRDQCGCPMGPWAFDAARYCGYAWWVRWLRAPTPPCPWHPEALVHAVGLYDGGVLLRWMRAQPDPCPWHPDVCSVAAEVDAMQFRISADSRRARRQPSRRRGARRQTTADATNDASNTASVATHVPAMLAWLRAQEPPCPWNERACSSAAWHTRNSGMEVLRWLRAQTPPCPWDARTLVALVCTASTVEAFVWAWDNGAPCDASVVGAAAREGRLDLLAVVLDRCGDATTPRGSAVWTPRAFASVAHSDDPMAVITWLSEKAHCAADSALCTDLARRNRVDVLAWARARGFPLDASYACYVAAAYKSVDALAWLRDVERVGDDVAHRAALYAARFRVEPDAMALIAQYWPNVDMRAVRKAATQ
ncbi:hypothetical protein TW95_gp1637 [Pandoravirus inopinatum]|uniref:Ankyrin repeat protein n=1 Tax=Pandoravirus inopinatum TaxID=1605721 RepID=A0A0B5JBH8_9VIRU|nr:hypothetical protein TW95_gp1637 [Pandoravirus inopinatum]AJF98371.1 hypothetical protein [Pandoravirus inopinatum]